MSEATVVSDKMAKKIAYFTKLKGLMEEYPKVVVVSVDNVGSNQMQCVRMALRGSAVMLMGKNSLIRKCIREAMVENPKLEVLLNLINGNVGLIFTKGDVVEIRDVIREQRVGAPAKAGTIAPLDVSIPAGQTDLEPTQTSFLQILGIATKISRGKIEILADHQVIVKGEKVGSSEAVLLQKLGITPFSYGLELAAIYDDGMTYSPAVLDLEESDIVEYFLAGVQNVAAASLEIGYPTLASVPHSIINAFKNIVACSVETDYTFPGVSIFRVSRIVCGCLFWF